MFGKKKKKKKEKAMFYYDNMIVGPDGVSNYHVDVRDSSYVGHGSTSTEATSDTQHLYRAPKVLIVQVYTCECYIHTHTHTHIYIHNHTHA